eukprot:SAG31_NODE_34725_length_330_cov_0.666667_1_plen_105_part_01
MHRTIPTTTARRALVLLLSAAAPRLASSHGTLNLPESRNGAQAGLGLRQGGRTQPYSVAYWFTDLTHMAGNATIPDGTCSLLTCAGCAKDGKDCYFLDFMGLFAL